ncbi:SAV_2336 N-terminal domain-related protein [Streptomyces bacillaris]|uniref:SAV_2336 N-terminal domain-related protein n=1 Tax=Streptomyces bacillaris TaxID=68179 RepID=UPI0036F4DDF9
MPDHLSRLLHGLRATGTDLDATALAEAVWLAATSRGETGHRRPGTDDRRQLPPSAADPPGRRPQGGRTTRDPLPPGTALHERLSDSPGRVPGEPVAVTRGPALPHALDLLRALRAYKRPWAAGLHTELDIERTIDGYARSGELIPAFHAAPERWFDLLLIVDRSLSMQVWDETVAGLEGVLDHLGAFRLLRTWGLTFEDARPVLHDHQGAVAGPDHVLSPQGRRLVLVVSDCSSSGWYQGEIWRQLRAWAQSTPVALLDPLPPKLWRRSALDLPGVNARQAVPGNGSTTLRFDVPLLLDDVGEGTPRWLPLPVLSLSPHSLGRWAHAQMRGAPGGCDAVLVPATGRLRRGRPSVARPAPVDPAQAFLRTASPDAVRLAALCALVGRISLPVLQLIRQELAPAAGVADIAELVTSDIVSLHPQADGTFVVTFRDGADEELKRHLPDHEAWRLCGVLEKYVSARADSAGSMPAVLYDSDALGLLPAELRPFGRAAYDVLQALGVAHGEPALGSMASVAAAATARIAGAVDVDEILSALFDTAVPAFADFVALYLREPLPVGDERLPGPYTLRRWREHREADHDFLRGQHMVHVLPGPLAEVLRGVRPVSLSAPVARDAVNELIGEEGEFNLPTGGHAILAPLRGRRRVIGVALFLRRDGRRAFVRDDLVVAAQLATHSALGVDKAMLYRREAYIADELQRTMLPQSLPQPAGVQLATRYLPAAETARVGGDWYDVVPLPDSRVALVIGDVMGHSMASAAIMGQLRTTLQTLAGLDLPPREVLHHLDEQAQRLGGDRMATCLYAVYDPVAHRLTIANAGHPPPILLYPDGMAEVLRVPPGGPIGVGGLDFEEVELEAPPGAALLLYTDGLVESRRRDVWTGIELVRARLAEAAGPSGLEGVPPGVLCDRALDMIGPDDRDDDIALLAARFEGIASTDVAYWILERDARSPGRARRRVRETLARWELDDLVEIIELLVSEVVTNAARHSSRPVTLRLFRTDVLRCEVGDDSPRLPRLQRPWDDADATDGMGLYLLEKLSRRWGVTRLSAGKVVWFEYALPDARQEPEVGGGRE